MPIARGWFQGALLTYLVGFTVLGVLAYLVYRDQPPLPTKVIASDKTLFTSDDVLGGMHVFQRYGLMEYGSVYGHGAYLGPDFRVCPTFYTAFCHYCESLSLTC
jgi:nitric oxide reductase subunit B